MTSFAPDATYPSSFPSRSFQNQYTYPQQQQPPPPPQQQQQQLAAPRATSSQQDPRSQTGAWNWSARTRAPPGYITVSRESSACPLPINFLNQPYVDVHATIELGSSTEAPIGENGGILQDTSVVKAAGLGSGLAVNARVFHSHR